MSEWLKEHVWKANWVTLTDTQKRVNAHAISDLAFRNYRSV